MMIYGLKPGQGLQFTAKGSSLRLLVTSLRGTMAHIAFKSLDDVQVDTIFVPPVTLPPPIVRYENVFAEANPDEQPGKLTPTIGRPLS